MTPWLYEPSVEIHAGDALAVLRGLGDGSASACVTSPPYLDARPEYDGPAADEWLPIFAELRRVVAGAAIFNVGRLWRNGEERLWWTVLIDAARSTGWKHLDTELWLKPNANPIHGAVLADSHEYALLFGRDAGDFNTDSARRPHAESTVARFGRGWTNHRGVKQPRDSRARKTRAEPNPLGARPRSYFAGYVGSEKGNPHPAPMARDYAEHLVLLASWPAGTILDPFAGSGTTGRAAVANGRDAILIEKDPAWCDYMRCRGFQACLFADGAA